MIEVAATMSWGMRLLLGGAAGVVVLALWGYLRLGQRAAAALATQLAGFEADRMAGEALQSFRFIRGRAWAALARGTILLIPYGVGIGVLGASVFVVATWGSLGEPAVSLGWWETLPSVARYAGYFVGLGLVACTLIGCLYHFRILAKVREGKRLRWKELGEELDTAVDRGGVLSTVAFGGGGAVVLGGWGVLWAFLGEELAGGIGIERETGRILGLCLGATGAWVLCVPLVFLFAVMAIRDPGWLSAAEASIGVAAFRRRETLRTALYVSLMAGSVYYWPAAIWMLLDIIERQELLVTVLLRERRPEDVTREADELAPARENALRKAEGVLTNGRYLDALNTYQMVTFKDPLNTDAWEGVARAQLCIGNRMKAKEALERLLLLDAAHEAGVRLMGELQAGLWNDGGERYEEAKRRCTQVLGKGVELKDVLAPGILEAEERGPRAKGAAGSAEPDSPRR